MKDQLITFETAKLAKELGFDEFTNTSFILYLKDGDGEYRDTQYRKDDVEASSFINGRNSHHFKSEYYEIYSRPTQSLLQKWIREKHNLHIHFNTTTDNKWYCTLVMTNNDAGFMGGGCLKKKTEHDSYEQALEEALFEALKLVKNGQ